MHSLPEKVALSDVSVAGKRVLIRVDYNVPIDAETRKVAEAQRIAETIPTIEHCLRDGASLVVLASHLGRPNGRPSAELSLKPVALELQRLLKQSVLFVEDCVGPLVEERCNSAPHGSVILLENLRFHLEEEHSVFDKSSGLTLAASEEEISKFCKSLGSLGDILVMEAFGTLHRAHSSIVGLERYVDCVVAGPLVSKELKVFAPLLPTGSNPSIDVAIVGGAKVADKILLVESLLEKVRRTLVVAGGLSFTFMRVLRGMRIGDSLFDERGAKHVHRVAARAAELGVKLFLPIDFIAASSFNAKADTRVVTEAEGIPDSWLGVDCGPATIQALRTEMEGAKSILWNGAIGVFEIAPFSAGTKAVVDLLATLTKKSGCVTIAGGGDTAAAISKWSTTSSLTHVSTGGGATLELLEGKELPGLKAIRNK